MIKLPRLKCLRCGHTWVPRREKPPKTCPKCHSPYWNKPRQKRHKSKTKTKRWNNMVRYKVSYVSARTGKREYVRDYKGVIHYYSKRKAITIAKILKPRKGRIVKVGSKKERWNNMGKKGYRYARIYKNGVITIIDSGKKIMTLKNISRIDRTRLKSGRINLIFYDETSDQCARVAVDKVLGSYANVKYPRH